MSAIEDNISLTMPFRLARILLAEDLMINQELTRKTLEAVGHQVDVAADGVAALAAAENGSYDLILMDVQMPVMDGIAATRAIRAIEGPAQAVPIVALTSYTHPSDVAKFGPAGMDSYMAKPYSDHELYALVELWQSEGALRKSTAAPAPARSALDQDIFQNVVQMVGANRIHALLGMLKTAFETPVPTSPIDDAERAATRFTLHSLVSQAGQVGFRELSQAARALETAIAEDSATAIVIQQFEAARKAACFEINRQLAA